MERKTNNHIKKYKGEKRRIGAVTDRHGSELDRIGEKTGRNRNEIIPSVLNMRLTISQRKTKQRGDKIHGKNRLRLYWFSELQLLCRIFAVVSGGREDSAFWISLPSEFRWYSLLLHDCILKKTTAFFSV